MEITVRNHTDLPNKYVRFIKWKLYGQREKFEHLHYARVFLNAEGRFPQKFYLTVQLGIPGKDIILKYDSFSPKRLVKKFSSNVQRFLADKKKS